MVYHHTYSFSFAKIVSIVEKIFNYWNSANQYLKCKDIVKNLTDMMENFELIISRVVDNC